MKKANIAELVEEAKKKARERIVELEITIEDLDEQIEEERHRELCIDIIVHKTMLSQNAGRMAAFATPMLLFSIIADLFLEAKRQNKILRAAVMTREKELFQDLVERLEERAEIIEEAQRMGVPLSREFARAMKEDLMEATLDANLEIIDEENEDLYRADRRAREELERVVDRIRDAANFEEEDEFDVVE